MQGWFVGCFFGVFGLERLGVWCGCECMLTYTVCRLRMYKKACVYGGLCRIAGYSSVPLFRRCVRGLGKGTRIVHFLH